MPAKRDKYFSGACSGLLEAVRRVAEDVRAAVVERIGPQLDELRIESGNAAFVGVAADPRELGDDRRELLAESPRDAATSQEVPPRRLPFRHGGGVRQAGPDAGELALALEPVRGEERLQRGPALQREVGADAVVVPDPFDGADLHRHDRTVGAPVGDDLLVGRRAQAGGHLGFGDPEVRRGQAGDLGGEGSELHGVGPDGDRELRHHERDAVHVEHRAAVGRLHHPSQRRVRGTLGRARGLYHLDLDQPAGEHGEARAVDGHDDPEASGGGGRVHISGWRPPRAAACGRCRDAVRASRRRPREETGAAG